MPYGGGGYGSGKVGDSVAKELKRSPASRVSYNNTKREPRSKPGTGKFAHIKPVGNPAR